MYHDTRKEPKKRKGWKRKEEDRPGRGQWHGKGAQRGTPKPRNLIGKGGQGKKRRAERDNIDYTFG